MGLYFNSIFLMEKPALYIKEEISFKFNTSEIIFRVVANMRMMSYCSDNILREMIMVTDFRRLAQYGGSLDQKENRSTSSSERDYHDP